MGAVATADDVIVVVDFDVIQLGGRDTDAPGASGYGGRERERA